MRYVTHAIWSGLTCQREFFGEKQKMSCTPAGHGHHWQIVNGETKNVMHAIWSALGGNWHIYIFQQIVLEVTDTRLYKIWLELAVHLFLRHLQNTPLENIVVLVPADLRYLSACHHPVGCQQNNMPKNIVLPVPANLR
jgi:hypothetical protein